VLHPVPRCPVATHATRFAALCLPALALPVAAADPAPVPKAPAAAKVDFNRDIRPILSNNCYACHGPDEKVRKADLRLDTPEGATENGAITPGKPEQSELVKRISATDGEVMPPPKTGKKLTRREIELLTE